MTAAVFEANHTIHPEFAARNSPEIGFGSRVVYGTVRDSRS